MKNQKRGNFGLTKGHEPLGSFPGMLEQAWGNMDMMDRAALVSSPVPVGGDIMGLVNDVRHYINEPESLTWGNAGLSAMGLLPFVPPVMGITKRTDGLFNQAEGKGVEIESNRVSQKTQRKNTTPTAVKASEYLDELGASGKTLDYGAGLGENAKAIKADSTFEPFPQGGFKPTYLDNTAIPSKAFGKVVSTNVLNVLPKEIRDDAVLNIGRSLQKGGKALIQTWDSNMAKTLGKSKAAKIGPEQNSFISGTGTYQKGFTKDELQRYVQETLGDLYKVELVPAKKKISGVAVVITRTDR